MDLTRPLAVVTPTVDGDVLAALVLADAWFTPRRLQTSIGRHSEDGVRRALRRLVSQGIVDDQAAGNAVLYRLNRLHLAAVPIAELANLWSTFLRRTAKALESWPVQPKVAALFGSAARGTMTAESDIDVFLVEPGDGPRAGDRDDPRWRSQVLELEQEASRWTGNDVRVLTMTEGHVRAHVADEPVLLDIVSEGVCIDGDFDWLRRMVARSRLERA